MKKRPSDPASGSAPKGRDASEPGTLPIESARHATASVRRFRLVLLEGPDPGRRWASVTDRSTIGSHASNDFIVEDPTVSRFHCEIVIDEAGARARDLDSKNGTILDGT